ncbi:hypothetical protein NW768_000990 [Fusarium equiseti]|uniref:F-box domain-containing protein n=1 Tax=Fusarium equiseti TaxID=61235 RepID=A0ABQ8RUH0_FUSEQ|nr:hypothetical protein NW768_000990 [Fusarium equiseti]
MTMYSPLETLPTELLDNILVRLPDEAVVNLWKTNIHMSHRLDNRLFGNMIALNHIKKWACRTGDVEVLRAAVERDGDPNFVHETIITDSAKPRSIQLPQQSVLLILIRRNHSKAFDALLEMGATFEALRNTYRIGVSNRILRRLEDMSPAMLESLSQAKLGPWVLNTEGAIRSFGEFVYAGVPIGILRQIVQNPSELTYHSNKYAWTPLSSAIDLGKTDVVNMLMEKGANIDGQVEEQPLPTTFVHKSYEDKKARIEYPRPYHIPIFAAAKHIARSGLTGMLDLCLLHGADINRKSPAYEQEGYMKRVNHFSITPLMAYLEVIPDFPVKVELEPIAGIKYFISNGADIQLNESPEKRYFGSTMWLNVSTEEYCLPLSIVEVLLYKWGLSKLREPQFLETIKYLIAQGSGLDRAEDIILHFSFHSSVTVRPLPYNHSDHPNNVLMWWDVVEALWDKLDESKTLVCAGVKTQEQKDRLLYTYFADHCLLYPHLYGPLARLALDSQIALGADINAIIVEEGKTILFHVCDQINNAFVTGETEAIDTDYRIPEMTDLFQTKLGELVISLINKGAEPRMSVNERTSSPDDRTPCHVLKRDVDKATSENREFLVSLTSDIEKAWDKFQENGPADSVLVKRADILDLAPPKHDREDAVHSPGQGVKWGDTGVMDIGSFLMGL